MCLITWVHIISATMPALAYSETSSFLMAGVFCNYAGCRVPPRHPLACAGQSERAELMTCTPTIRSCFVLTEQNIAEPDNQWTDEGDSTHSGKDTCIESAFKLEPELLFTIHQGHQPDCWARNRKLSPLALQSSQWFCLWPGCDSMTICAIGYRIHRKARVLTVV